MVYTLRFFSPSKYSLFHNSNVFGSCIIHILYTGCAKIKKKNNSGAKRLSVVWHQKLRKFALISRLILLRWCNFFFTHKFVENVKTRFYVQYTFFSSWKTCRLWYNRRVVAFQLQECLQCLSCWILNVFVWKVILSL